MKAGHHADLRLLVDAVSRMRGRLRTVFASINEQTDLSDIEMTVLTAVAGAHTPPTVPRIGRSLGHPRQVVQRAANQLAGRGLIAMRPNPDHKRAPLLIATQAGLAVRATAEAVAERISEQLMQSLNAAAIRNATKLLNTLRQQIEAYTREGGS